MPLDPDVSLPDPVFILARVPEGGPSAERMDLFSLPGPDGRRRTPVFSTMRLAAGFLAQAQELGITVPLDYIFRAAGPDFAPDFPDYTPSLDPSAEAFFQVTASGR